MKFSFCTYIVLIIFSQLLFAGRSDAQHLLKNKISIHLSNTSLDQVLDKITNVSGISIFYDAKTIAGYQFKGEVNFENISLNQILDKVLIKTRYTYKEVDNSILILPKPLPPAPLPPPGSIKGRIVEFETSQPLPGASVFLLELKKGITSDNGGYYKFINVPPGKYTLQVSYVSFTTEKIQVEIKAGKEETYDVKMRGSNALNEVVVSGTRKTRAPVAHTTAREVLEEIKSASSVASGISSEQISKSADRNAAEAVRRVAGVTVKDDKFVIVRGMDPRYNLTYLNDNVAPSTELFSRSFALDLIPSRIIDKILIYKSPSPDLLGDMTGGAVKIYTKDAKNVQHFDLELQSAYRDGTTFSKHFLTYQGGKFDFLGFDDGTRKLPSTVPPLGSLKQAQISQGAYAQSFSPTLQYGEERASPNLQLTANYYNTLKLGSHHLSMLTSLSYKHEFLHNDIYRQNGFYGGRGTIDKAYFEGQNTETAQLNLLQNFTYHLRDSSTVQFKNFVLQQGQNFTGIRLSDPFFTLNANGNYQSGNQTYRKDNILSYSQRFLYAGNLGGNHFFSKGKQQLQWNAGYTYSRQEMPDQRVIRLTGSAPGYSNGSTDGVGPGATDLKWTAVSRSNSDAATDILTFGNINRIWLSNTEGVYNGSIDYSWHIKPWVLLKAGTYQQWKRRELYRRVYVVMDGESGGINGGINGSTGNYIDWNIVQFKEQDLGKVWSNDYLKDDKSGLQVYDRTSGSDAYTATEQNNSGYLAFNLLPDKNKWEIYGGLRVEYDRQKVASAIPAVDQFSLNTPILVDIHKLDWLPSLNIGYRPNNSLVFRTAYGRTVNRADFREIAPYQEIDYINNQRIAGNPSLQPATINNYDLRAEFYPSENKKGEVISIGAFYKQLNNAIERITKTNRISDGNAVDALPYITYQNAPTATIKGIEVELRKSLDFIPGRLFQNLFVLANASIIKSHVLKDSAQIVKELQDNPALGAIRGLLTTINRPLQGQAPYIINAGLQYDNAGTGTKVTVNYNVSGTNIYAASVAYASSSASGNESGYRGSLLELPHQQLDLAVTQRIYKTVQVKFSVQNILNKAVRMAEDHNFTYKYEPAAPPTTDEKGISTYYGDNIASQYNPGRYFILTLTYSL